MRVHYSVATGEVTFATGVRAANFRMQLSFADSAGRPNLVSKSLILPRRVNTATDLFERPISRERLGLEKELQEDRPRY